ncbi:hypothetical protein EVA_20971 [gut metagenome]|uniref:Uncharacterized protein n=1 Tax=gut metagenome TaxID=749906 RepID=J9BTM4_9ZZZZ
MIAFVRSTQTGESVRISGPVKPAAVYNAATYGRTVAVHVLGGRMGYNVSAPLKGTAVNGGGEGVVHNQGHTVCMSSLRKLFNVQHSKGRVCNGFAEYRFGVGAERSVQLFLGAAGLHKGAFKAHALHGDREQIVGAAVNAGGAHHMVATGSNVEQCIEVCCLTAGGQHGSSAALKCADLGSHHIAGGVLQTAVEIAVCLQIKKLAHIFTGSILKGGRLNNGDLTGFPVSGRVAALYAYSVSLEFHFFPLLFKTPCSGRSK